MRYFLILCATVLMTSCATRVYHATEIKTIAEKHTTIAIIQPKVDYKVERPDHRNWRFVPSKTEISAGIQLALAEWVQAQKDHGLLVDVKVLDAETTNKLLVGVATTDYGQLASTLGVDAVIASRLRYDASFDYAPAMYHLNDGLPQSRIYLNLFTPEEGLVWSYERGGTHFNNNYDRIVADLLGNAAKDMPYAVAK